MSVTTLTQILEELAIPRDRIIYFHSSSDWIARAGISLGSAVEALRNWTSKGGTLVCPSFPFRGSHEAYLETTPTFDVRTTPCRVGLLNETLRRTPGATRSLDPDLAVTAIGPAAPLITGSGLTGADPMGPDSPFQRVLDAQACLMGLGVSLNYMNMIHVLDARYRTRYPFGIYADREYSAVSTDSGGTRRSVAKLAFRNEIQNHIKPSRVVEILRPTRDAFRSKKVGSTDFFFWDLPYWEEICTRHIEERLSQGQVPCWLEVIAERAATPE